MRRVIKSQNGMKWVSMNGASVEIRPEKDGQYSVFMVSAHGHPQGVAANMSLATARQVVGRIIPERAKVVDLGDV